MLGRVHWLLWNLTPHFKGFFNLRYDYQFHKYAFYRNYSHSRRIMEFFIVVRTSKKCFRMSYFNDRCGIILYESFRTSRACATRMEEIFAQYRDECGLRSSYWFNS